MRTRMKPGEQLVLETRKHWFALMPSFIFAGLLMAGGALINEIGAVALVFPALALVFLIFKIMAHRCNLWAVTTKRMIAEEGFLSISAKVSPLDKINNIAYQQSLFGRLFGYGNVQIQTAASMGSTTFRFVSGPQQLIDAIMQWQANFLAAAEHEGEPAADPKVQSVMAAMPATQKPAAAPPLAQKQALQAGQRTEAKPTKSPGVAEGMQAEIKPVATPDMVDVPGRSPDAGHAAERHIAAAGGAHSAEAKSGYRTRPCPYCSEIISVNASLCRFCNKDL